MASEATPLFEFRGIIEKLDRHIKNAEKNFPLGEGVEKDFHLIMSDVLELQVLRNQLSPLLQQKVDKIVAQMSKVNGEGIESGRFFQNVAEIRKILLSIQSEILEL